MRGDLGGVTYRKRIKNPDEDDISTFGKYFLEEGYQMNPGELAIWTFLAKPYDMEPDRFC